MMGVFSDKYIKNLFSEQNIKIVDPFIETNVKPSSIDLRLGNKKYHYKFKNYTLGDEISFEEVEEQEDFEKITIANNETAFIGLHEKITIPKNAMGLVLARSSITRLGISIRPIYMNPGYTGILPLTITNNSGVNITVEPMKRVAQLVLFSLNTLPEKLYSDLEDSKYQDENVSSSKIYDDKEIRETLNNILKNKAPILFKEIEKDL